MTRADLIALAEAVERGDGPGNHVFALETLDQIKWCVDAWRGDLNAAVRMVEALLPGTWWCMSGPERTQDGKIGFSAVMSPGTHDGAYGPNPARAMLLAVLRAKLAEGVE